MAKRKSQSDHDNMVQTIAKLLTDNQYSDVKADIQGYDTPKKITWKSIGNGHVPDVTGEKEKNLVVEMETDDSINDQHTKDQWKLFLAYCKQYNADFVVVVPDGSTAKTEKRVEKLGITADIIEIEL